MAAADSLLLCSLLWIIITLTEAKEHTVTCVDTEECMLPCHFESDGKGARIMWYKKKAVVSCTRYGDTHFVVGHNSPSDLYKGRTGLYADQVLQGNATLLLRDVTPKDQGKYFCITMTAPRTDESSIISLIIKAPVREVNMQQVGDTVTCSAGGIYPAPKLSWSTDPPTDVQGFQNSTKSQRNQKGFYDIHSSIKLRGNHTKNCTYICSVTSDTSKRMAILKHRASIQTYPGGGVMIPCGFRRTSSQSFNLTWRFNHEEPVLCLNVTGRSSVLRVWERWTPHVSNGSLAPSGLQLDDLMLEHQGTYTCEVSTAEETYITQTDITFAGEYGHLIYMYVAAIGLLSHFLLLSYCTVAFLGFKIRKLQSETQEARRDAVMERVNLNQVNDAEEIQQ